MSRAATEYRYEKLTWPEINDAIDLGKVCIVPCGAVEQHGPHLPLDVDLVCPGGIAKGTGMAGQGINVTGNVSVVGNSGFSIGRFLDGFLEADRDHNK